MSELTKIPYVGKATAASLNLIGYETIASLKGADPEEMYQKECDVRGQMVDRCQLICTVWQYIMQVVKIQIPKS